jgi:DNA replication and repair protein RecF
MPNKPSKVIIPYLELYNFRSYQQAQYTFNEDLNIITGLNGSGKTNLVEAIYFLLKGQSFKNLKDDALININSSFLRLKTDLSKNKLQEDRVLILKRNQFGSTKKELQLNKTKKQFINNKIPVIIFEADQLNLLKGSPEGRRNYLDDKISQIKSGYQIILNKYKRTLIQRSKILKNIKDGQASKDDLFIWNIKLAELGSIILKERILYLNLLNVEVGTCYRQISKNKLDNLEIEYISKITDLDDSIAKHNLATSLLKNLESRVDKDILIGATTVGPHRDDWQAVLNNKNSNTSASRGETRSILLALKIFELNHIVLNFGFYPLVILDDILSELDSKRQQNLLTIFRNCQTFVTTTEHPKSTLVIKQAS